MKHLKILLLNMMFFLSFSNYVLAEKPADKNSTSTIAEIFQLLSGVISGLTFNEKNLVKYISKEINCNVKNIKFSEDRHTPYGGKSWSVLCGQNLFSCQYTYYPIPMSGLKCQSAEYKKPKISRGMTKEQVKTILGEPIKINKYPMVEQWVYPDTHIHFEDDSAVHMRMD